MKLNLDIWKKPTKEYRGKPFWALNGKLEKEELKFQIECMKKMGFGGAFLHSRTGLVTEYMSQEWLDLIAYCVQILKENDMETWLYDEDRWPSGTCGGMVTKNKSFQAKSMVYNEISDKNDYEQPENFIGLFAISFDKENKALKYRKITNPIEGKETERIFVFYYIYMKPDSFYNGYTYVDTMNMEATKCFIQLTHEKYKSVMGDKFGKEIVGIFTDEPHRGPLLYWFSRKDDKKEILIPYTYTLFVEFGKRKGYKIEDRLPVLWFGKSGEPFCKEMYDLVDVLQELFLENYAKPYHEWCKQNKLLVTGHILHEDNLVTQTTMCGSVMRYMEYMDYPGMDNLGSDNYCYNVPAMISSVAKQLGKEFVLDELYGCTGWNLSLADYKHIGDWQSFGGVTFRCPHLSWYTMRGEAKRDCPATILHQSAWWEDFYLVEDYFSRLQYLLKNGEDETDIAIINPIESTWGLVDQYAHSGFFDTTNALYKQIQTEYLELYKALWLSGINVDYIDEGLFAKFGKVSNGKFICGKKGYKRIVLNGNYNLRKTTFFALKEFIAMGGEVVIVGRAPEYLDGEYYDFKQDFCSAVKYDFVPEKVVEILKDDTIITDNKKIIVTTRKYEDKKIVFFLNSSNSERVEEVLKIKTDKECCCLDCRTGKVCAIKYTRVGEYIYIPKRFERSEELVILLQPERVLDRPEIQGEFISVGNNFSYSLSEGNIFILDTPEWFIDGVNYGTDYVLNVDKKVRRHFSLEERHNEMVQPWYKNKYYANTNKKYGVVRLKHTFEVLHVPKDIKLMCEEDSSIRIVVNGKMLDASAEKMPLDNCYRAFTIPAEMLKIGENVIETTFDFYEYTNIESMFLVGQFGVYANKIDRLPLTLTYGDLSTQGLPHFGGKVKLFASLANGRYLAKVNDFSCSLVKINQTAVAFPPYQCEFYVENEHVEIELTMTRHNMFMTWLENDERKNVKSQGLTSSIEFYKIVKPAKKW